MGQYLTIGIVTKYSISKQQAKQQASATPEEVKEALQEHCNKDDIYQLIESDDAIRLLLKPEIAEAEMIEFLKDFYSIRYPNEEQKRRMMAHIKAVEKYNKLNEWLDLAETKDYYAFQLDYYVSYYIPFHRGWTESLDTSVEQIILSLDGKILMECYDDLFSFFTSLLKERLSKYRLANSLLVYISG